MKKLKIDNDFRNLISPPSEDEYRALEQSILSEGCRDAILVWNDTIIDGHNRYEICRKHNIDFQTISKEFASKEDVMVWMIENQMCRRNISDVDRILLAQKKTQFFSDKTASTSKNTAKEVTARLAGVSKDKLSKFEQIQKSFNGKELEAVIDSIRKGETTVGGVYKDIKRKQKAEKAELKRVENAEKVELLDNPLEAQGLFQTIVIDPPWDWSDEGDENQFGRAKPDYHTMSISEIEELPINQIADDNCHLYLWVTNRSLPKAFRLIEKWGFRYITCITWIKPSFGMGNYFRGSTEQILFAVKGSQMLKRKDVGTHFEAARGKGHSSKPNEFYELIESCSYGPYIDVFGRGGRDGWTVWGADAES